MRGEGLPAAVKIASHSTHRGPFQRALRTCLVSQLSCKTGGPSPVLQGRKLRPNQGKCFWPKATHGALMQALDGSLLAPNSVCFLLHPFLLNIDMSSQPVICLSFPFCKNRRGKKWNESWDLGVRGKKA